MGNIFDFKQRELRKSHREMAAWMCENPMATLAEMAAWSGYSYAYCSTIVNSDAFQSFLHKLEEEVREKVLVPSIRDRITGAAAIALDKLSERLAVETSAEVLTDSTEVLLKSLGYGVAKAPVVNVTNNSVMVADKEVLARGRALLQQRLLAPAESGARAVQPDPIVVGD